MNGNRIKVARFDTVVFNPETKVLEVWRYRTGQYGGEHETIFSRPVRFIKGDPELREAVWLIADTVGLLGFSIVYDLPSPWQGYRFS